MSPKSGASFQKKNLRLPKEGPCHRQWKRMKKLSLVLPLHQFLWPCFWRFSGLGSHLSSVRVCISPCRGGPSHESSSESAWQSCLGGREDRPPDGCREQSDSRQPYSPFSLPPHTCPVVFWLRVYIRRQGVNLSPFIESSGYAEIQTSAWHSDQGWVWGFWVEAALACT